jgi:hypothetical protein
MAFIAFTPLSPLTVSKKKVFFNISIANPLKKGKGKNG